MYSVTYYLHNTHNIYKHDNSTMFYDIQRNVGTAQYKTNKSNFKNNNLICSKQILDEKAVGECFSFKPAVCHLMK